MQQLRRQQQRLFLVVVGIIHHWRLQLILWLIWTSIVCLTAFVNWYRNHILHLPINTLGLAIHCSLVGILGMIVITYIEMHWQPWRFFDQE